jgi:hypothetical protein
MLRNVQETPLGDERRINMAPVSFWRNFWTEMREDAKKSVLAQFGYLDKEKAKEIVSILMESPLYLDLPLIERIKLIRMSISMVQFV